MVGVASASEPRVQVPVQVLGRYIPPQCYTKTEEVKVKTGQSVRVHNPCFACHTKSLAPNFKDDAVLQLAYSFPSSMLRNPWSNLFKDFRPDIAKISDQQIERYIAQSNYQSQGKLLLSTKLASNIPKAWDINQDGHWNGYVPDAYFRFDNQGFDHAPNGQLTGWRAFGYRPFMGAFWPTNGSTDDTLIRLSKPFQTNEKGQFSLAIYKLNLAIVEALIQRRDVPISPVDETLYGVDLNRNGKLDIADKVVYRWAPLKGQNMSYVGQAKALQQSGRVHLAAGLYPEGTEFLHTVRYISFDTKGNVVLSPRMKEVRYARKVAWNTYFQLRNAAMSEVKEADDFPERLRRVQGNEETGLYNGQGWVYQGFIEDKQGALRPQTYQETLSCIGCHSGIGATTDSSFAFPRKLGETHFQQGWFHASQHSLKGVEDRLVEVNGKQIGEFANYLLQNHSGNEFRDNNEVEAKFFDKNGQLKPQAKKHLEKDITYLLWPSQQRAMQLNKAYKVIVDEQSFAKGRDAHIEPLNNVVYDFVEAGKTTGVKKSVTVKPIR
ncbi:hypothetical protein [Hydrogenovibrio kuenenii]|uniref:hypothetical protein n=1 Tax=Hydrogenovibrio kuenenii TaxID=63658 RepID=UPI0004B0E015|nr:hypothetical protein [Hydrogenovibrio kuenenii]